MGLYGKWSTCRSCYAALLLGGSCGLLSHSGCTQKRQNEQCLTPQWRGKKSILKQPWGRRKARVSLVYQRKTWCRMESAVFRRHLQDKKKLCALQSSWIRQQPAPVPSKRPSAGANTQEMCPAALCHCKTHALDEVRSWKVLSCSRNRSWQILQQLNLEGEQKIPASDGIAYTSSLLTTVQLKNHSAIFIFCIYILQTTDFWLFPTLKRRAFHQRYHTDT